MDIYWAVYYLDLNHHPIAMTSAMQANILRYILKSVIEDVKKCKLRISFFAFKQQDELFNITNKI